jgi:SAM-dependent MidA family methyltransferase
MGRTAPDPSAVASRDADAVRRRVVEEIRSFGPIAFDRFMELALYGEAGYFESSPVGSTGDFVTSPHVHPWFAYGIARAFGDLHTLLGSPSPALFVEVGAGDGTLARQLLEILAGGGPLRYVAVERGARARATLEQLGVDVRASIEELDTIERGVVVANELLDNLPFARVRRTASGLVEVLVGTDGDRLGEVEAPVRAELADAAETALGAAMRPRLATGDEPREIVLPTGALSFVDALAGRMTDSYALLIDYSAERGRDVHGYHAHRVVEDVLERPGSVDVTAGVDFDVVEARASERGLSVLGRVTQRGALLALGFDDWVTRDRAARTGSGPGLEARAWAARNRASLLVAPDGLGAHRWLLLATPGLARPAWLEAALARPSAD